MTDTSTWCINNQVGQVVQQLNCQASPTFPMSPVGNFVNGPTNTLPVPMWSPATCVTPNSPVMQQILPINDLLTVNVKKTRCHGHKILGQFDNIQSRVNNITTQI